MDAIQLLDTETDQETQNLRTSVVRASANRYTGAISMRSRHQKLGHTGDHSLKHLPILSFSFLSFRSRLGQNKMLVSPGLFALLKANKIVVKIYFWNILLELCVRDLNSSILLHGVDLAFVALFL
jgi:hypothetical protein